MHARLNPCYISHVQDIITKAASVSTYVENSLYSSVCMHIFIGFWNDDPLNGTQSLTELTMAGDSLGFFQFSAGYKPNR